MILIGISNAFLLSYFLQREEKRELRGEFSSTHIKYLGLSNKWTSTEKDQDPLPLLSRLKSTSALPSPGILLRRWLLTASLSKRENKLCTYLILGIMIRHHFLEHLWHLFHCVIVNNVEHADRKCSVYFGKQNHILRNQKCFSVITKTWTSSWHESKTVWNYISGKK